MAQVLVVAQDRPVPDSWARWYRGMPVIVKPDGWQWGREEGPPKFRVLSFPHLTVEQATELLADDSGEQDGKQYRYARRAWVFPEATMRDADLAPGGRLEMPTIRNVHALRALRERFPRDTVKRLPAIIEEALDG